MSNEIRRNMALFPIGIVMKLTDLTARQIRYYEQNDLIQPARTEGKQRLFSFNDVDRLLEIKELIEKGLNIAGIKQVFDLKAPITMETEITETSEKTRKELTDKELHQLLKQQITNPGAFRHGENVLLRGELSRFFH
ncbi:MerR family transcriptional regulator [Brevibacillus dissolubilis]|uniref:MerR family transcriptional regulator n=1 Tax=Brevibacillus dissolubilis TaxID=1844116 RepID=UPI001116F017|nr:MerR family transcriptional regulator [Brevibacillus dissolubilis]